MKIKAKMFATMAHKNQKRKLSNEPYVSHPIRVAKRLEMVHGAEELICAAYLHDVVEDTDIKLEEIEQYFGSRVAQLVDAHTEDKSKSWKERKQDTIDTITEGCLELKYLIVADKLDNLLDVEHCQAEIGDSVWDAFNRGKEDQKWYNEAIACHMYDGLAEEDVPRFFHVYEELVEKVFH